MIDGNLAMANVLENEPDWIMKEQAIKAMQEGKKVWHRYFSSEEWVTMKDGMIHLEDGVICYPEEFWNSRQDVYWEYDWMIIN